MSRVQPSLHLVLWLAACGEPLVQARPPVDPRVGTWRSEAAIPGGPMQEVAAVVLGDEIVVLGGLDDSRFTLVEALQQATSSWRAIADLPIAVHHQPNAAVAGGVLFVLAGLDAQLGATGEVYRYEATADRWLAGAPIPAALFASEAKHGGKVSKEVILLQHTNLHPTSSPSLRFRFELEPIGGSTLGPLCGTPADWRPS